MKQLEAWLFWLEQKQRAGGSTAWPLPHSVPYSTRTPEASVRNQPKGFWEDSLQIAERENYSEPAESLGGSGPVPASLPSQPHLHTLGKLLACSPLLVSFLILFLTFLFSYFNRVLICYCPTVLSRLCFLLS